MTTTYIQERSFASCKHKISQFKQLSTAACQQIIRLMWKEDKMKMIWIEENYFLCCAILVWIVLKKLCYVVEDKHGLMEEYGSTF